MKLLRKSSLNENKVCGNRNFWKAVCQTRPLQTKKITIMEGDDFMKYGEKTAKVFNTFFSKTTHDLIVKINVFMQRSVI